MNFWLIIRNLALAVHQLNIKTIALQWIFAFVVMSILMVVSLAVSIPAMFGKELTFRRGSSVMSWDSERQPLLSDDE
jgi:hypothetical protein